jgi:hypothetical protein
VREEVTRNVKKRLIRWGYTLATIAALVMVLGAGKKWPGPR